MQSPIKYLEYSAFGAPGVYSNLTPYSKIIDDGKNGFLASSYAEWETCLSRLIEDEELENIVLDAQDKVKKHWLLSQNAEKQLIIYHKAIANNKEFEIQFPSIYPLIKSITRQNYELNQINNQLLIEKNNYINELMQQFQESKRQNQLLRNNMEEVLIQNQLLINQDKENKEQNQILTNQLEEKKQQLLISLDQIKLQEEVILSYALSKSWQITRPFRKIIQLITKE